MMRTFLRPAKIAACVAVILGLCSPSLLRANFFYQFNNPFSGMTPVGPAPWISALFTDVSPGTVQLTITAVGLTGSESVGDLLLNLDPSLDPKKLNFSLVSKIGSFTTPTIADGKNKYKATGDGKYDIDLSFSDKSGKTFGAGESVTFNITSSTYSLDALDFDFLSTSSAGKGSFLAAAEILDIPGCETGTGWIAPCSINPVPEPSPVAIFTLAASLLAGFRLLRPRRV